MAQPWWTLLHSSLKYRSLDALLARIWSEKPYTSWFLLSKRCHNIDNNNGNYHYYSFEFNKPNPFGYWYWWANCTLCLWVYTEFDARNLVHRILRFLEEFPISLVMFIRSIIMPMYNNYNPHMSEHCFHWLLSIIMEICLLEHEYSNFHHLSFNGNLHKSMKTH